MAIPKSREEFKKYCLRKLGAPVITINVADEQVDDRIDEALKYYQEFHFDGTIKTYFSHMITDEDLKNKFIEMPEEICGVIDLLPIGSNLNSIGMFDIRYQYVLNEMVSLNSFQLVDYYMALQNVKFMEELLLGKQPFRFNRHENKLYIDMNWEKVGAGNYIVAICYAIVDPEKYPDVWGDRWLGEYATAKIQYQWGLNLTKFSGLQMPGNVQFNADRILDEAKEKINKMEEEMIMKYQTPPDFFIG